MEEEKKVGSLQFSVDREEEEVDRSNRVGGIGIALWRQFSVGSKRSERKVGSPQFAVDRKEEEVDSWRRFNPFRSIE